MKLPQLHKKTVTTMFRALASAILIALVAIANGVSPDLAANFSLIVCFTIWFTWPALRRLPRLSKALRRALRRNRSGTPARTPVTPPPTVAEPALTQINHHHHYYAPPPGYGYPPSPGYHGLSHQPLPAQHALPRYSQQRMIHDQIYSTVDPTVQ
ncbi:hypothetical protein [Mycolicibacterium mucogenicum]|jgi:hypothetical protein|uniref:hypothetical protein n=1 Tax=Mycolicibacterium mucogenicum TaxID=56689 RepID=UPI000769A678|nr:hypothetical protein [Mycolicibacterium mucogenicum]